MDGRVSDSVSPAPNYPRSVCALMCIMHVEIVMKNRPLRATCNGMKMSEEAWSTTTHDDDDGDD